MNRPIEFRAWDKEEKRMLSYAEYCSVYSYAESAELSFWLQSTDYELMQFTGLLDKNGVKIFEGDLCQYFKDDLLLVEWHQPDTQFKLKRLNGIKECLRFDCDIEVIGNCFQNPELLEKK